MSSPEIAQTKPSPPASRFRDWFAASLGVKPQRKEEIYLELSRSASLRDTAYWLQLLFAAGVATLGLTLNSPAVIIGAMLISPLMGPILASGLALAAGDLILGLRAGASLALSCLVAIAFSVLLVGLLPFKEMTGEIAARTQPNTLDLFVALFSGAIGSVAICKEVKGVVTSIPGVAIAVALMPPLCVVGYGVGVAVSLSGTEGWRVARGGGLLFLTNLVAITFTAMMVFLALHIATGPVKERVREWRREDQESVWVRFLLMRFHISDKVRNIGGAPARLLGIFIPLVLILIPLSQSLGQLKQEYIKKQTENSVRRVATNFWQRQFAKLPSGEPRSVLDQIAVSETDGKIALAVRVFTSKPYTVAERDEFGQLVAARLGHPADSVAVQLLEIPTAASLLETRAREEKKVEAPPTVAQLRANFWQGIESSLRGLRLPPAARLLDYHIITSASEPLRVVVSYLGDREIEADAQALLTDDIRLRVAEPAAAVVFERVPATFGPITFKRNQAILSVAAQGLLNAAGQALQQRPGLRLEVSAGAEQNEQEKIAEERAQAISEYLVSKWQLAAERINITSGTATERAITLKLQMAAPTQ
jgi:uncharacterized hydrophobic protein (TIGR00271 family)